MKTTFHYTIWLGVGAENFSMDREIIVVKPEIQWVPETRESKTP
jgi:hypothetical protein